MTWRGLMVGGLLILLSFSASVARAQSTGSRDPFARIGVPTHEISTKAPVKPRRYYRPRATTVKPAVPSYNSQPFVLWLQGFKNEAQNKGIAASVVEDAFRDIYPNDTVVTLDRKQPEDKISFSEYQENTVSDKRIERGRALMAEHAQLLKTISATYQVPAEVIVALWGMETEYGANKGNFSLIQSLTTLAYEGRRAEFFRGELLNVLKIMQQEGVMGSTLTGSWAGAMGQCQFMPSSYLQYAVDWDQDGHRDIWNSVPDALASIAHYLHKSGWNPKFGWGREIVPPPGFSPAEADLYTAKPLRYWRERGVKLANGTTLPGAPENKVYMMYPGKDDEGAYMVYDNYHVLLKWNRSRYFATSVGLLADALAL